MLRAWINLAMLLAVSSGLAVAQENRRPTSQQRAVIKAIERDGIWIRPISGTVQSRIEISSHHNRDPRALTPEEADLLEQLPPIHTMSISAPGSVGQWLTHAPRIPGLKSLRISLGSPTAALSPGQLNKILRLGELEELTLWECGLRDADIGKFAALGNLRTLRIGWARLSSGAFSELGTLAQLREIQVDGNRDPTDKRNPDPLIPDWPALARLKHLETLSITRIAMTPARCRGIESLPELRHLTLDLSQFDDTAVDSLKRIPKIETLSLMFPRVTGRGLAGLRDAKNLKTVNVSCPANMGAADVAFLLEYSERKERSLGFNTSLSLAELIASLPDPVTGLTAQGRDTRFGSDAPYQMTISTKGRTVQTQRNLTDDDMSAVARQRELRSLWVSAHPEAKDATAVTCDGLRSLNGHPNLRSVSLELAAPLDGPGLAVLGTLPSLESVMLGNVALGADGLRWLPPAKNLTALVVTGGSIHGDALVTLRQTKSLKRLSFQDVRFEPPRLTAFAGAQFPEVAFRQCDLSDADCLALGKCKAIQSLTIDGAAVTDAGIAHLAGLENLQRLYVKTSGDITLAGLRRLGRLPRLRFIDAVGQGDKRLGEEATSEEFGWTFHGDCGCSCMDIERPSLCQVTKAEIRDGAVAIAADNPDLHARNTQGLRFRGPMDLKRLTLRAADFPFDVRQIHFNDCRIDELVLVDIEPQRIARWGDTRIGRVAQNDSAAK